ncbi:MAG: cell division protein FtsQ/DivIB, partial [Planctomycetota bacterium]
MRYLRREGNRRVRALRRRRTALRVVLGLAVWGAVVALAATGAVRGVRWATSPGRFPLHRVEVRGVREARQGEIRELVSAWMGRNLLNVRLSEVEKSVRRHPWIGPSGQVRIQRRLPGALQIRVRERVASGLGLVGGIMAGALPATLPVQIQTTV